MTDDQLYALYLDAWARTTSDRVNVSPPHCNDTAVARLAITLGVFDAHGKCGFRMRSEVLAAIKRNDEG